VLTVAVVGGNTAERLHFGGGYHRKHARAFRISAGVLCREPLQHAGAGGPLQPPHSSRCWDAGALGVVEQKNRTSVVSLICRPAIVGRCRFGSLGLGDQSHSCTLGWRDAKRTSCPSMQTASPLISSCVRCIRPSRDAGVPGLEGSLFDPPASQRPKPSGRTCFRESSVIGSAMPPTYASTAPITGSLLHPSASNSVLAVEFGVESIDQLMQSSYLLQEEQVRIVHGPGRRPVQLRSARSGRCDG
jgi:hypothetical protein